MQNRLKSQLLNGKILLLVKSAFLREDFIPVRKMAGISAKNAPEPRRVFMNVQFLLSCASTFAFSSSYLAFFSSEAKWTSLLCGFSFA